MSQPLIGTVSAVVGFVDRLYGRRASAVDLSLGLIAFGWLVLEIVRPELFDQRSYTGMAWMPDEAWMALFGVLTILHARGLLRPFAKTVRTIACAGSSWVWLFVSLSLARIEVTTGVWIYAVVGVGALGAAIYVANLHPDGA